MSFAVHESDCSVESHRRTVSPKPHSGYFRLTREDFPRRRIETAHLYFLYAVNFRLATYNDVIVQSVAAEQSVCKIRALTIKLLFFPGSLRPSVGIRVYVNPSPDELKLYLCASLLACRYIKQGLYCIMRMRCRMAFNAEKNCSSHNPLG